MLPLPVRFVLAVLCTGSVLGLCPARPSDESDAVKAKLVKAREEYAAEVQKFNAAVTGSLDKREEAARAVGSKKALDEVKAQRKAFEEASELPRPLPSGSLAQVRVAVTKFDAAHVAAVKAFTMIKEDAAAEAVEKERQRFALEAAIQFGRRTPLATLKPHDVRTDKDGFSHNTPIKVQDVSVPHCIFLHPTSESASQASYTLKGRWTALRARVGVPKFPDTVKGPASELTFEVVGDGKSLWKSKPSGTLGEFQVCEASVANVKVLTLRVHCPQSADWARAYWLEPILCE